MLIAFIVFFVSCTNNGREKKIDSKSVDSSINNQASTDTVVPPAIEKEFDTVNVKPVEEPVVLKFNFQKGKTYNYTMSFDVFQKKGDQSRGSTMKWNYDIQVVDEKGDIKTLKTTYKRIDMTINMGNDRKMEFSSENETDAMDFMQLPSRMFKIVKGKSFTMQVNEKGEVVSVTGFD